MPTHKILTSSRQFRQHYAPRREFFQRLAREGQSPEVLFIACSDSRMVPELITCAQPGDLFVLRHVANIVPPLGTGNVGTAAVIEYAVLILQVKHIVICGHTDCGGIRALDVPLDWSRTSHIARWLEHARPALAKVEATGLPAEERHLTTVRENVLLQLEHLRSYHPVREGERASRLTLHGWVYHLETGSIAAYEAKTGAWRPLESST